MTSFAIALHFFATYEAIPKNLDTYVLLTTHASVRAGPTWSVGTGRLVKCMTQ